MSFITIVAASAVLALSSAAPAAPPAAPAAPQEAKSAPERVICTKESVVGSNRPKKVCLTASQRALLRERSQEQLGRMRDIGGCPVPNDETCGGSR